MKKNQLFFCLFCFFLICVFSSCSSTNYGAHFQPSKHSASSPNAANQEEGSALVLDDEENEVVFRDVQIRSAAKEISSDVLPKAEQFKSSSTKMEKADAKVLKDAQVLILKETKERIKMMGQREKRQLKREIKKLSRTENAKGESSSIHFNPPRELSDQEILALVFAVIIPPLGVYLHQGVTEKFWISLILTVLGVSSLGFLSAFGMLPAIAYSVLVVLDII